MRPLVCLALCLAFGNLLACGTAATCPAVAPADGTSCSHRSLVCETGGDTHLRCTTVSACQDKLDPNNPSGTAWSVKPPVAACMTTNDTSCAVSYGNVPVATVCPTAGATCDYPEGRCGCVPCDPTGVNWRCRAWADGLDMRCPSTRPLVGSRCEGLDGVACNYDNSCGVSLGPDLVCTENLWTLRLGAPRTCAQPTCGIDS